MESKMLGYALAGAGTLGVLLLFEPVKTAIGFDISKWGLGDTAITIVSIALLAVGAFIASKGSFGSSKVKEVPIYHEKNVVGFRRIKQ